MRAQHTPHLPDVAWRFIPEWLLLVGPVPVRYLQYVSLHPSAHSLLQECNGPRSLPPTEPDWHPVPFTVFPAYSILWNGPRRQGFASPRNNGAPLTTGRSKRPTNMRERP